MNRALLMLALVVGCADDDASRKPAVACSRDEPCESNDQICYANLCFDTGNAFTDVLVEIQPRSSSGVPRQLYFREVNLAEGRQRMVLRDAVRVPGEVQVPSAELLPGTLRFEQSRDPSCGNLLVGEVGRVTQSVGTAGEFEARLVPGRYLVSYAPNDAAKGPPIRLPSVDPCGTAFEEDAGLTFVYPPLEELVHVRGTLRYSTVVTTGVLGAQVTGTALDERGEELVRSSTVLTDAEGRFDLTFPAGAHAFVVSARAGDPVVLSASWNVTPAGEDAGTLVFDVGTSKTTVIRVTAGGVPVVGAVVAVSGDASPSPAETTLSARAQTNMAGSASLALPPGTYRVSVAPPPSNVDHWAQTSADLVVPEVAELEVALREQTRVFGRVESSSGFGVGDSRVTFTLVDSPVQRAFTTTSDSNGDYELWIDPLATKDDGPATYNVDVVPAPETGEPWHHQRTTIAGDAQAVPIQLLSPTFLYGTLVDPSGAPLDLANLTVYSEALGTAGAPLVVGTTTTDELGVFALPLPSPD